MHFLNKSKYIAQTSKFGNMVKVDAVQFLNSIRLRRCHLSFLGWIYWSTILNRLWIFSYILCREMKLPLADIFLSFAILVISTPGKIFPQVVCPNWLDLNPRLHDKRANDDSIEPKSYPSIAARGSPHILFCFSSILTLLQSHSHYIG